MAGFEKDESDWKGLEKLLKAFKGRKPVCKLGILSQGARRDSDVTNAQVGAVHEFGAPGRNIPQRSFLRMPLNERLSQEMESAGLFEKKQLEQVIQTGSLKPWLKTLAVLSQGIVMDAFETGGFGKWPPWKDPDYTNEGEMILVDTQQLRDSISFEVKDG